MCSNKTRKVKLKSLVHLCTKFPWQRNNKIILKIGLHLSNVDQKSSVLFFLRQRIYTNYD